jgi:hypothetical protein
MVAKASAPAIPKFVPKPLKISPPKSKADAEKLLEELAIYDRNLAEAESCCNTEITKVRESWHNTIEQSRANCNAVHAALEEWATGAAEAFPEDKKSMELLHGTLSFRTGQRKLALLARETWEKVIDRLTGKFSAWRKVKVDVDAAKILRDSAGDDPALSAKDLSALGLKIIQEERFHVELKEL